MSSLRYIPLSYNHADSQASALRLVLSLNPDWEGPGNQIEFVRFTDGITNTVCADSRLYDVTWPHQTNHRVAAENHQPQARPDRRAGRQRGRADACVW